MTLPWLEQTLDRLVARYQEGRLPHALLLSGPPGTGKQELAVDFAARLLCSQPTGNRACGQCPACAQRAAGSHPDYQYLTYATDEKTGKRKSAISVDQVRALIERLTLGSHAGGMKVVLITPADGMNPSAANSLLKTLEEPSDNTVLVLVSDRPAKLPATIRSRCQQLRIELPPRAQALAWLAGEGADPAAAEQALAASGGAPLRARALASSGDMALRRTRASQLEGLLAGNEQVAGLAREWSEDEDLRDIRWLRDWTMDLLRIGMTGSQALAQNSDVSDILVRLAGRLNARVLFQQLDLLNRLLKADGASLNRQLMTEDLLLGWISSRQRT